jgi:hypothetical protein
LLKIITLRQFRHFKIGSFLLKSDLDLSKDSSIEFLLHVLGSYRFDQQLVRRKWKRNHAVSLQYVAL